MSKRKTVTTLRELVYDKKYSPNSKPTPYAFSQLCDVSPNTVYRLLDMDLIFVDGKPYFPMKKFSDNQTAVILAAQDRIIEHMIFDDL